VKVLEKLGIEYIDTTGELDNIQLHRSRLDRIRTPVTDA
jgi:hypothetical protein